ncbi:uronate dehydrogenase [Abditibacteriota bacterium]|nr:uronate dehydrogenase [Abditibacteriota bacterium]
MKVLITGAGGNLGRALVPLLLKQGHTPRLLDFRPLDTPHEFVQGDVRNLADVQRAVEGVDGIIHGAALHGIHMRKWAPEEFWAINSTGTFNVFESARQASVKRVVLCSTMGVYGHSAASPPDAWGWVSEELPLLPSDVYGMSKVLCEEMARYYGRSHGISTVALRLGMFVPESSGERYGFRLLFGGVDERDVAQAALLSLTHAPQGNFDAFNIMADVPFTRADASALQNELVSTLERYYPTLASVAEANGWNILSQVWGRTIWSIQKARELLGYEPRYNFQQFLEAVEVGNADYAPTTGTPWWGV